MLCYIQKIILFKKVYNINLPIAAFLSTVKRIYSINNSISITRLLRPTRPITLFYYSYLKLYLARVSYQFFNLGYKLELSGSYIPIKEPLLLYYNNINYKTRVLISQSLNLLDNKSIIFRLLDSGKYIFKPSCQNTELLKAKQGLVQGSIEGPFPLYKQPRFSLI